MTHQTTEAHSRNFTSVQDVSTYKTKINYTIALYLKLLGLLLYPTRFCTSLSRFFHLTAIHVPRTITVKRAVVN